MIGDNVDPGFLEALRRSLRHNLHSSNNKDNLKTPHNTPVNENSVQNLEAAITQATSSVSIPSAAADTPHKNHNSTNIDKDDEELLSNDDPRRSTQLIPVN